MDGVKLAALGLWAAHKFFFWSVIEWATKAIYWHKVASQEQLILRPRKPKDLYDNGYALFVYDMPGDAWRGYWRTPQHQMGMPAAEVYEILPTLWGNVPFHEVEFSDMPEITFKVRAVSLAWCREQMPQAEPIVQPEARRPADEQGQRMHYGSQADEVKPEEIAEAAVAVKH